MNKFPQKFIFVIILAIFIVPQVTFAAWWNPFTWGIFHKADTKTEVLEKRIQELESKLNTPTTTPIITKFYTKYDNVRIRACASTTGCDVIGYYHHKNTEITVQGEVTYKLADLPEWLEHMTSNGLKGFINKSILSEKPTEANQTTQIETTFESDTTSASNKDLNLSGLDNYIDVLISGLEANKNYFNEMRKSTDFYGANFEKARSLAIAARDGGTLPSHLTQAMDLFISAYVDTAIKTNNTYRDTFTMAVNDQENVIVALRKEKNDRSLSGSVSAEQYLAQFNKLKKHGDNIEQNKTVITKIYNDFVSKTEKNQLEMSEAMAKMTQALDAYYLPQINAYKNASQNNSVSTYQPVMYPQIQIPKTTNCTMGPMSGARGYYTVSCY